MAKAGRDVPTTGEEALARALEACAVELDRTLVANPDTALTLREGVEKPGCSVGQLARLVHEGKIPNAGRPGGPRIACGHLSS